MLNLDHLSLFLVLCPGSLPGVLGVFQKLIASKANDQYGFALISGIVQHLPLSSYQQYMPTVWQLLFTRLQVRLCADQHCWHQTDWWWMSHICWLLLNISPLV
jgi:hypothetical protein